MEHALKVMELVSYVATALGIPIGIAVFWNEKRKERRNREIEIYIKSCDCYLSYLDKILAHPNSGCGDFRGDETSLKQSGLTVEQITIYEILFMTMEQAHFLYAKSDFMRKNATWDTWRDYIAWWAGRPDFQKAWDVVDPWIDPDLRRLIEQEIGKNRPGSERSAAP
ncbi:MAG TPA: hypothetical protein VK477_14415 [Acidobacteriota bacterium]|nr:hypothetical protein [Acidobacteriota bacterium]